MKITNYGIIGMLQAFSNALHSIGGAQEAAILVLIAGIAFGQEAAPEKVQVLKTYQQPALLTSAGHAADVLILKGLCARAGITVKYRPEATADSLEGVKAVILVAGGSSKGLGAAKADPGAEQERIKKLVKAAQKAKLPLIVFHIGGEARRGPLSDPFNKIAAESGEVLVISQEGDADGFFKKIADKSKADYISLENSAGAVPVLKQLFPKVEESKPDSVKAK